MPTRFLKWFFAFAFATFLCAVYTSARADQIARHGEYWVRLTPAPCTDEKVVGWLVQRGLDPARFNAGKGNLGVIYNLCYALNGDKVLLMYEDGDQGTVERNELQSAPEA